MSHSNCCTTPISHKSSDVHTHTPPFVAATPSGGKPTALAYPTAMSMPPPVRAWRLNSLETTSSGLIRTVRCNVRGCLSRCCRTATSPTLRPFPMRSNRAGSPASFTHSNTSAARRRSLSWTMQRHSSSTRAGTRAKCCRRYVPCATTMTLSHGLPASSPQAEKPGRGRCRAHTATDHDGSLLRWSWSVPRWRAISITSTNR